MSGFNKMSNTAAMSYNEVVAKGGALSKIGALVREEIADIKTCVSEAVTNAIIHGYPDCDGVVKIITKLTDDNVEIEISDTGVGIENIEEAREPLFTTKSNLERSGMGFTIMENFMDNLKIESISGLGTKITMKKKIKNFEAKEKKYIEIK